MKAIKETFFYSSCQEPLLAVVRMQLDYILLRLRETFNKKELRHKTAHICDYLCYPNELA